MYGPTGIGVLYGKRSWLEKMPPYQGGGDMISSVTFEKTTYNALPWKFEAGTSNIAGAVGLAAAIDWLSNVGLPAVGRPRARPPRLRDRAAPGDPGPPDLRNGTQEGRRHLLPPRRRPPPRHRDDPRPGRDRHPDRPALRPARDGPLRHPGHRARVVRRSTTRARTWTPSRRACGRCGRSSADDGPARALPAGHPRPQQVAPQLPDDRRERTGSPSATTRSAATGSRSS